MRGPYVEGAPVPYHVGDAEKDQAQPAAHVSTFKVNRITLYVTTGVVSLTQLHRRDGSG